VVLDLAQTSCAAGDTVVGRLHGVASPVSIRLVEVERSPCGVWTAVVAEDRTTDWFTLPIPPDALPSAAGVRCALAYVVKAADASAELDVTAEARPHLAGPDAPCDPLVADWDARHFHLELADAELRGGGRIAGRVHRHGDWHASTIAVRADCTEAWRPRSLPARGRPFWDGERLWEANRTIALDRERTWAPFRFELPRGLPPAIEARTIAWRYEVRARCHAGFLHSESAALTPLLYD
jgi:hypothetical protein